MHSDFIVFADESGDHSLAKINPDYPVFVLSFCVFRRTEYFQTICSLLQQFKLRWWIHDGVVLHSLRIRRKELPFVFLKTLDTRERFMADLTETLANCPSSSLQLQSTRFACGSVTFTLRILTR